MRVRASFATIALIGLSLLLGSRWLVAERWPASAATPASGAWAATIAAAACLIDALRSKGARTGAAGDWQALARAAGGGALLFSGAGIVLLPTHFAPGEEAMLMAMTLTPIVIALGLSLGRNTSGGVSGRALAPPLLALAGLLLILPQPSLGNMGVDVALLAAPLLTGWGAVLVAPGAPPRAAWKQVWRRLEVSANLAGGALGFTLLRLLGDRSTTAAPAAVGFDLGVLWLTMFALRGLGAARYASVFALVPLLLLLQGMLFSRVLPSWQQGCGLGLLAWSAAWLFRGGTEAGGEEQPGLFG